MEREEETLSRIQRGSGRFLALALGALLIAAPAQTATKNRAAVENFRLDASEYPKIRLFIPLRNEDGELISEAHRVKLTAFFQERELAAKTVSEGFTIFSVLVLDRSGSMLGDDLAAAKSAALAYVEHLPESYRTAVVSFAREPLQESDFTSDRRKLSAAIDRIQARAGDRTALQDALGYALELLRQRSGRKHIVALTDGMENESQHYRDLRELLQRSIAEEVSISVVGLGTDVNREYLRQVEQTGGTYLPAPRADQLVDAFLQQARLLQEEQVLEFVAPSWPADGLRKSLQVFVEIDDTQSLQVVELPSPGVLPHVRGDHTWYLLAIAILLLTPKAAALTGFFWRVHRFRMRYLQRVGHGSPCLNEREANAGDRINAGDLILLCPVSGTPHFPRSWRLNRCRCMREYHGQGSFCYHKVLPAWMRRKLDNSFGHEINEAGRRWLCRCAGDRDGY
jgi:VWFA-related protein